MTITRPHHPLRGQVFEVLRGGPAQVVIRLADGTSMRLPRGWTDADGSKTARRAGDDRFLTIDALRRLLSLLDAFSSRDPSLHR